MDDSVKKGLYYLGIVAALYIFFFYILPLLVTILGFAFKIVFYVFMWGAIAFVVVMVGVHIMKIIKKEI
ncbi:MAG TPA: hypothetical protein PLA65_00825 [Spirochaetota bacterium]|nr:hypothetical protein [Spirochaetota bacterium]HOD15098.1 hypothetical protein [Spirochaetota bacterium]HPG51440.1 hypothetical protein [Spirochaetota bacterium]HPN10575.1 hypothetical protein [Spirochaetota bacterium]